MPFLTLTDPKAKIKGSRDPLGLQSIWTRFGRQIVTNLTTVTTSVRGFTTLLLGLYFAEQYVLQRKASESEFSDLFLKFEQLAAYSRVTIGQTDAGILGIQRVKKNLVSNQNNVTISAHPSHQILSNQKTYGLWGLYTVAARNSGLLEGGEPRLSLTATNFVESEYLPHLPGRGHPVFQFLERDRVFKPNLSDTNLALSLAKILGVQLTPSEKAFYSSHVLFGDEQDGFQKRLWRQIKALGWDSEFDMRELKTVIEQAKSAGDLTLAHQLDKIRQVELVIAPLAVLFGFIISRDEQPVTDVVQELKQEWGPLKHIDPLVFEKVLSTIEDIEVDTRMRLIKLAKKLYAGDYAKIAELLLAHNKAVMAQRGSEAWVRQKQGQFDVRFRDVNTELLPREELPHLWLNSYFINSLKSIGLQIH